MELIKKERIYWDNGTGVGREKMLKGLQWIWVYVSEIVPEEKQTEIEENWGAWEGQDILEEKVACVAEVLGQTSFYIDYQIFLWAQDGTLTRGRATRDEGQTPLERGQSPFLEHVWRFTISTECQGDT